MKPPPPPRAPSAPSSGPPNDLRSQVRWALAALAAVSLGLAWLSQPQVPAQPMLLVASALLVVLLLNLPVMLTHGEANLAHFVGLMLGLVFPGPAAAAIMGLGVVAGDWVRAAWRQSPGYRDAPASERWSASAMDWAQQILSVLAGTAAYSLLGGPRGVAPLTYEGLLPITGLILAFILTHAVLLLADLRLQGQATRAHLWDNLLYLVTAEALPIPFAVLILSAAEGLDATLFLAMGSLLLIVAVAVNSLGRTTHRLEKNLREMRTLTSVSRAMRTSLDLEALLEIIYLQVAYLLSGRNFYVALLGVADEIVHFPVAYRDGLREHWPSRPLANRLTDRVIRSRAPLVIAQDMPAALRRMGLEEESSHSPVAWLGIPLLSAERVLGCMAVFTTAPGRTFSDEDLNLLTTVGAQASVGIENAQLYGETQRRAAELRTLTELSTLMSATLNPERVLELVCSSVIRVVGCDKAAIFLKDPERNELWLARAEGLSSAFMQASLTISLDDADRARSVVSGQPVVVPDIRSASLSAHSQDVVRTEGFSAYADLPLRAHGEIIGFLCVYYTHPHRFRAAEIELLKTFANQAALAVANARMYANTDQALARRVSQLSALEAIGREVSSTLELDRLFDILLERAMASTNATRGRVVLLEDDTGRLVTAAVRSARPSPGGAAAREIIPPDQGAIGASIRTREPVSLSRGDGRAPGWSGRSDRPSSELSVPILHEGRSLGAIALDSSLPSAFSSEDAQFLTQVAIQASIAIQNGRLFARVREGRDRLAAVLNSTREGVLMIDAEGHVALANPQVESLLGLPTSRLIGQPLRGLMLDSGLRILERLGFSLPELQALLDDLAAGNPASTTRVAYELAEARRRFLERSGAPVQDDAGRVIGWVMVLRDVSEEKELAEVREQLTSMIVHDLRSPLNAVLGSLGIIGALMKPGPSESLLHQAQEVAARSCKKLLGLVDSMLDISRMESGEVPLTRKPLRIQALVDDVISDLVPLAAEQGILLINRIPADLPAVPVDEEKAGRVFTNLLDNALKFTPDGGQVTVEGWLDSGQAAIFRVLDDGPGIPEEYRQRIFDRFVQMSNQPGRRKGSGLGLAFCKLAVEAHGGRIWVENRPEGGAAFVLSLPLAPAANETHRQVE